MSGPQINRANWTKERVNAFRKYLGGDEDASFRGRKRNGDFYKSAVRVAKLIGSHRGYKFSIRGSDLIATDDAHGARKILTDAQVVSRAQALFKQKDNGMGKAPSIYHYLNKKFINVSYKKVETAIKALPSYQKFSARHLTKPASRKVIVVGRPGEALDTDVMYFSTEYYRPSHNEGYDALLIVVDRFSGWLSISPLQHGKKKRQPLLSPTKPLGW